MDHSVGAISEDLAKAPSEVRVVGLPDTKVKVPSGARGEITTYATVDDILSEETVAVPPELL